MFLIVDLWNFDFTWKAKLKIRSVQELIIFLNIKKYIYEDIINNKFLGAHIQEFYKRDTIIWFVEERK